MLVSTYDIRNWLGLEDGDKEPNAKFEAISKAVQDFCCTMTGRQLEAKHYATDPEHCYLDGKGERYLYLPQYPVSYVASINIDADRAFGSSTQLAASDFVYYSSGKVYNDNGLFYKGRRNILVDYVAGYAPVVGGTWNSSVSTYPIPNDLKQVMVEMSAEAFKEGLTAVHSIVGSENAPGRFVQLLTGKSFWRQVLNFHANYATQTLDE
jgi:hypothetical protein